MYTDVRGGGGGGGSPERTLTVVPGVVTEKFGGEAGVFGEGLPPPPPPPPPQILVCVCVCVITMPEPCPHTCREYNNSQLRISNGIAPTYYHISTGSNNTMCALLGILLWPAWSVQLVGVYLLRWVWLG